MLSISRAFQFKEIADGLRVFKGILGFSQETFQGVPGSFVAFRDCFKKGFRFVSGVFRGVLKNFQDVPVVFKGFQGYFRAFQGYSRGF